MEPDPTPQLLDVARGRAEDRGDRKAFGGGGNAVKSKLDLLCGPFLLWIVGGSIRSAYLAPGGDPPRDVVGISTDAVDLLRGDRVKELQTDEEESRLRSHHPSFVHRLFRAENGEVDEEGI